MSPILSQKIQQHCQRLCSALPGVAIIEKSIQDWDCHIQPAVQGYGLDWERRGRTGGEVWSIRQ